MYTYLKIYFGLGNFESISKRSPFRNLRKLRNGDLFEIDSKFPSPKYILRYVYICIYIYIFMYMDI